MLFHAIAAIGAIATTVNPLYTVEELVKQLKDSKARLIVTVSVFLDKALAAQKETAIEEVFVFGEAEGATPFASLLKNDGSLYPEESPITDPKKDLICLPYSSGTSGVAKGVCLSHYNVVANLQQAMKILIVKEEDVALGVLPFFHIYGMVVIMNLCLRDGATIVTVPKFEPEMFLSLIQEKKITVAHIVPPLVLFLAKHPIVAKFDLTSLRYIVSGAAPLSAELQGSLLERFPGLKALQGYGMTELSPVACCVSCDDDKLGTCGKIAPNTEIKFVDPDTKEEKNVGEQGELWIRGPQVMQCYLGNPTATAETIDADGFLHTGDIGYIDADGFVYVVDRVKELIKYKGYQVAPAELEGILISHPAVADAAVIPVADEEAGELPKAFVVMSDASVSHETIMAFVAEHVAPHKKIRLMETIDAIPKSASGKILRRVLRARAK